MFGVKTWFSTLGTCIPCESEDRVSISSMSFRDLKEPLRATRILTVITLSASKEMGAWCKCYEKE